jgi:hypothetical protein
MGALDTYLRWREKNKDARGYDIYHPSAFGGCLRQMQYKRYASIGLVEEEGEEFDSKMLRLFETGHHTQSRWEKYFTEMGILRGVWVCANPFCYKFDDNGEFIKDSDMKRPRIFGTEDKLGCFKPERCVCGCEKFYYEELSIGDKELNMFGHSDMVLDFSKFDPDRYKGVLQTYDIFSLPSLPVVADMKTINSKRFEKMIKFGNPPSFVYQIQLQIYMNMLGCDYGVLIYECKDDSRTAAYKIDKDLEQWETIKAQAKKMNEMATTKNSEGVPLRLLPPPRPRDKTCWECNKCGFNKVCRASSIWDDPNLASKRSNFYGNLLDEDE